MVCIRVGQECDVENANTFYAGCGSSASIQSGDVFLIATENVSVIGIVRLCTEYGHLILRGMLVHGSYRGKGVGKQMLFSLEHLLLGKECYCLPFAHLSTFYGKLGFIQIAEDHLPLHLQRRLSEYRAKGLNIISMKRVEY